MTALEVMQSAAEALRSADAASLMALTEEAAKAELPRTAGEMAMLRESRRILERLLALTGRNLAILRRTC